jgi:hypothetical protein
MKVTNMDTLVQAREGIRQKLLSYPLKNKNDIKKQWFWLGIFGGHRYSLGQDNIATLMAISFGGVGLWWLKDKSKLDELTNQWNHEQENRQNSELAPQGTEGLIITDPVVLESAPVWINQPNGIVSTIFMLMFTFPIKLSLAVFKVMKVLLGKIPVISPIYTFLLGIQESILKRSFAFMEALQIGFCTGIVSYLAAQLECIELSFLMIGVSAVLTFTSVFTKLAGTAVGRAALEWDYLLCSYYHHHRPDPFLVAYVKSVFLFIPRLLGLGSAGERNLYNRLSSQAALLSFIFIPIESITSIFFGQGFSFLEVLGKTFLGIIMSVILLAMYAPAICGSLTRHKLLGETVELKLSGGLSILASIIGLYFGLR